MKQSWEKKLEKFYQTNSTNAALEKLKNIQKLIIIGCSGSGKSAIAYHIAFFYEKNEGYTVIPLSSPDDIFRFRQKNAKQVLVFGDAFGSYSVEQSKIIKWDNTSEYLLKSDYSSDLKIILTCRSEIYGTKGVKELQIMRTDIHVHTAHKELSLNERKIICKMYLSENDFSRLNDDVLQMYPFLPWICSVYERTCTDIIEFFKKPKTFFEKEINALQSSQSYFALVLLVVSNNKLQKHSLESGEIFDDIFSDSTNDSKVVHRQSVLSALQNLEILFIKETDLFYYCMYDEVFDIIAHSVGSDKSFTEIIVKHAFPEFVSSRIYFKRFKGMGNGCEEYMISIEVDLEMIYFDRILHFLRSGLNWAVFGNVQCQYEEYRKDFICFLNQQKFYDFRNASKNFSAFYISACLGYYDFCKFIADLDLRQMYKLTESNCHSALHQICDKGHFEIAELVVQKTTSIYCTSLFLTITGIIQMLHSQSFVTETSWYDGIRKIIYILLIKKESEICCFCYKSPLIIAIDKNHESIVELFLPIFARVYEDFTHIGTPLHYACTLGRVNITEIMIKFAANINIKRKIDGLTPLHCACRYGHVEVVRILLNHSAKINISSNDWTPLMEACLKSNPQIVKLLLENGASANIKGKDNTTPLHVAATIGNAEIVQILLEENAVIDTDIHGYNPLHIACSKGHVGLVVLILNHLNPDSILNRNNFGMSPLVIATSVGHVDVVRELLNKGAYINYIDKNGMTALEIAVENNSVDVVELLCNNGASLNHSLHYACRLGNENFVKLFFDKCTDVFKVEGNFGTPLHETCGVTPELLYCTQNYGCLRADTSISLEYLSEWVRKDITGIVFEELNRNIPSLHLACYYGDISVINHQIKNGANVNAKGPLGIAPISIAGMRGMDDVVKFLLDKGASINQQSTDGYSPLMFAYKGGHTNLVNLLLNRKASVNQSCRAEFTPLQFFISDSSLHELSINFILFWLFALKFVYTKDVSLEDWLPSALITYSLYRAIKKPSFLLHHACSEGNQKMVEVLLEHGALVNISFIDGKSPLYKTCEKRHMQIAKLLLMHGAEINQEDENGRIPLHIISESGSREDAKLLINNGASINKRDSDGKTPLYISAQNSNTDVLEYLLQNVSCENLCSFNGRCPLHAACAANGSKSVTLLLNYGSIINCKDNYGFSPLHLSCHYNNFNSSLLLISNNADLNIQDSFGNTPLHIACFDGSIDIVLLLLSWNATINVKNSKGMTALHCACMNGFKNIVILLLNYRANIFLCDVEGKSCLELCVDKQYFDIAEIIIVRKKEATRYIDSLFSAVCISGEVEFAKFLIKFNASVNKKNKHGKTPLFLASENNNLKIVKLLLRHGANINERSVNGMTPIFVACVNDHQKIAECLVEQLADINLMNNENILPYDVAKLLGFTNICRILKMSMVEFSSNVTSYTNNTYRKYSVMRIIIFFRNLNKKILMDMSNYKTIPPHDNVDIVDLFLPFEGLIKKKDSFGRSSLHRACYAGKSKIVKHLLDNGATLSEDKYGLTDLHFACLKGHTQIVLTLLQYGSNVNQVDVRGNTPLHLACFGGYAKIADILIKGNAHVDRVNYDGQTALSFAIVKNHAMVVGILLKHEASVNKLVKFERTGYPAVGFALMNHRFDMAFFLFKHGVTSNELDFRKRLPLKRLLQFLVLEPLWLRKRFIIEKLITMVVRLIRN